ncbi:TerB family tellurite resistance protein [Marivirga sp.]|uniref:TerB family tellurite resistance protein n=1 Tax=Marivirga sp. TaxID=2018662 RepID=UPI002D802968|nr:TerB family tellurite resistance protein [Marivirga sp.]HET8859320.1 TerB family tellurite resistance protein [Marivirga sp.]
MLKEQLKILIKLATIDNELADKEANLIEKIGKANGVSEDEIYNMMKNPQPIKNLDTLSEDQRFEYLYNIVQLMKIDGKVYKSEIVFCQEIAERLGYKKKAVAELSKSIYSDPSITSDREQLKTRLKRYSTK